MNPIFSTIQTMFPVTLTAALLIILMAGCDDPVTPGFQETDFSTVPDPIDYSEGERFEVENGLIYYIVEEGEGQFRVTGRDVVRFFVTLRSYETGEIIQSTYANGRETADQSQVAGLNTTGFQMGISDQDEYDIKGMKEGEIRVLIVPPHLGFEGEGEGSRFYDWRNDRLIYEVELVEIL